MTDIEIDGLNQRIEALEAMAHPPVPNLVQGTEFDAAVQRIHERLRAIEVRLNRSDPTICPSCGAHSGICGPPDSDHCSDRWHR